MKEVEIKILEINKKEVEAKLISLGAKKIFEGELEQFFFDNEENSLAFNKKILRIRTGEASEPILNLKTKIKSEFTKTTEELEIKVSDLEIAKLMLKSFGLLIHYKSKKQRTSYMLENARIEIDTYLENDSKIPTFLEIEAPEEETIIKTAEKLGFSKSDCKPWSLNTLKKHYSID
jgi:adenylate cyclase, class 2